VGLAGGFGPVVARGTVGGCRNEKVGVAERKETTSCGRSQRPNRETLVGAELHRKICGTECFSRRRSGQRGLGDRPTLSRNELSREE